MLLQRAIRLPGGKLGRWETVCDDSSPTSSLYAEFFQLFRSGTWQIVNYRYEQEIRYRVKP